MSWDQQEASVAGSESVGERGGGEVREVVGEGVAMSNWSLQATVRT